MPYFIDRNLTIYKENPLTVLPVLKSGYIVSDTEFTKKLKLSVDCIGVYFPQIVTDFLVVFTYEELTPNFHPIIDSLNAFGYSIKNANTDHLMTVIERMQESFNNTVNCELPARKINKAFKELVTEGYFDYDLIELNVDSDCLTLEKDKNDGSYAITIKPPKLNFPFLFFYGFADLFKIWGKNYQHLILDSQLVQQRCLKVRNAHGSESPVTEYNNINGILYEMRYTLREAMYRFPPRSKGLDAQTSIFKVNTKKINVKTWAVAKALGFDNLSDVMENFATFLEKTPNEALKYHATDIFATWDLSLKQQEFFNVILRSFDMQDIEIADTTGSNVSKFIVEGMKQEFKIYDKESEKTLRQIINLARLENLENSPLNDYGCQPFLTVGGLLFSRMAKIKFLQGILGDCDEKSCYASSMSNMNVYLGEPVTITCKYDKYKISLKDGLELIENKNSPDDGWFIRVSGKLKNAINTLVLSDLKFKPKSVKQQALHEVSSNRKSIQKFNAFKTSKRQAQSTILTKEIKFGIITKATIEALKKLPTDWYQEFLDLKCDAISFIPGDLIADTLEEYLTLSEQLPDHDCVEKVDIKEGVKINTGQQYKNNVCLKFPINKYWKLLKQKRAEFKTAGNPIQEVFKLFQNSGYGVLACLYLTSNNLMASNQVTADARAGAWLMTNALNGFGAITDGCSFSWDNIPLGYTFRDILKNNPQYLEHFDKSVTSKLDMNIVLDDQSWMNKNMVNHMKKFFQIDDTDYNLYRFDFELKTEVFPTKKYDEWVENNPKEIEELKYELGTNWDDYLKKNSYMVETTRFTKFYNNNAGNYCKGINDSQILIDGEDYNIVESQPFVKARSFQGGDKILIDWYCNSILQGYTTPLIYKESKLIKFGDGNQLAIRFLESGSEHIAHPMGFDTVAYKMMKLVTRSQFLFRSELQLRNFETNEATLANLSNEIGLNLKIFWDKLTQNDIATYNIELRKNVDYFNYAKHHPVGIGFELLALLPSYKGDIELVREKIVELIDKNCTNFNAALNISRSIDAGKSLKNMLGAVIVAKKNAEDDLRSLLENSADEPTLLSIKQSDIKRFEELVNHNDRYGSNED